MMRKIWIMALTLILVFCVLAQAQVPVAPLASFNRNGRIASITVAAADSPPWARAVADYVCDGVADEQEINWALAMSYMRTVSMIDTEGSKLAARIRAPLSGVVSVKLFQGSYTLADEIDISGYRFGANLRGSGIGTVLYGASGSHVIRATRSSTARGEGLVLEDMMIIGDEAGLHNIFITNHHNFRINNIRSFSGGLSSIEIQIVDFAVHEDDDDDNDTPFSWVLSTSGTGEYWLCYYQSQNAGKGIDPYLYEPTIGVTLGAGSVSKSLNAIGSLDAGEWGFGNNDTIGYDTIYVRLSDDSKPDPGDVELNSTLSGGNVIENCQIESAGKYGIVLRGIHDTDLVKCNIRNAANIDVLLDFTSNVHVSVQIDELAGGSSVGYKAIAGLRNSVDRSMLECSAEASARSGSFMTWDNVGITGTLTIGGPYDTGANSGLYAFNNCQIAGVLSVDATIDTPERLLLSDGSYNLGNIAAAYIYIDNSFVNITGSDKVATLIESTTLDAGFYSSNVHYRGTAGNRDYKIQPTTAEDSYAIVFSGGKTHSFNFTVDGNGRSGVRVSFVGVSFRTSDVTIDECDYVVFSSNHYIGGGGGGNEAVLAITDADSGVVIGFNTLNEATITVDAGSAADVAITGNTGGTDTTITSNATGTDTEANNPGVTVSIP